MTSALFASALMAMSSTAWALTLHVANQDEIGHIPLHQQALNWAMKKNVDVVQLPSNDMVWKFIKVNP